MAEGASTLATKQPSFYNSCFSYRPASAWHNAPSRDAVVHDAFQVAFDASGIAEHVAAFLRWAMLTPSPFASHHAHHAKKCSDVLSAWGPAVAHFRGSALAALSSARHAHAPAFQPYCPARIHLSIFSSIAVRSGALEAALAARAAPCPHSCPGP